MSMNLWYKTTKLSKNHIIWSLVFIRCANCSCWHINFSNLFRDYYSACKIFIFISSIFIYEMCSGIFLTSRWLCNYLRFSYQKYYLFSFAVFYDFITWSFLARLWWICCYFCDFISFYTAYTNNYIVENTLLLSLWIFLLLVKAELSYQLCISIHWILLSFMKFFFVECVLILICSYPLAIW